VCDAIVPDSGSGSVLCDGREKLMLQRMYDMFGDDFTFRTKGRCVTWIASVWRDMDSYGYRVVKGYKEHGRNQYGFWAREGNSRIFIRVVG
jgi:hypothetical protein